MVTTIQVDESTKEALERLKIHKRQPFNEVILELIKVKGSQTVEERQKQMVNSLEEVKKLAIPVLKGYNIKKAAVFGSFARGDAKENSDIDLLVKYKEGTSLFDVVRLQNDLETVLGRKVDLVSYDFIDKYIKERVLKESISLYE